MSRPSFRPRPLDIHRRLPIVRFAWEFEDDDATIAPWAAPPLLWHSAPQLAADDEADLASNKKNTQEIATPHFDTVDTYEKDYTRTFAQPATYLHGRGAEAGDFIEYDLDNEDEDWLEDYNNKQKNLNPEMLEILLFKLEILDHKARERAGIITPTMLAPIPVILQLDFAFEALEYLSVRYGVFQVVYSYWKSKRERWQKPILRHLQTKGEGSSSSQRRMQRRENNAQSFEKLRLVKRNLEQAKVLMEALIKREEKKREAMEFEVHLQRIQMKYKHEALLLDDGIALSRLQQVSSQFGSSEDEYCDSDDTCTDQPYVQPIAFHPQLPDKKLSVHLKHEHELKRLEQTVWLFKGDPEEPVMLFTRPLDLGKLGIAGIKPLPGPPINTGTVAPPFWCQGRIGRGGRIIFDRWNPLPQVPIGE